MSTFLNNLVRNNFYCVPIQKFMLNCCKQDITANSNSDCALTKLNNENDNNRVKNEKKNNEIKEIRQESPKMENQNKSENKPSPSTGFKRTKTKHYK